MAVFASARALHHDSNLISSIWGAALTQFVISVLLMHSIAAFLLIKNKQQNNVMQTLAWRWRCAVAMCVTSFNYLKKRLSSLQLDFVAMLSTAEVLKYLVCFLFIGLSLLVYILLLYWPCLPHLNFVCFL